MELKSKHEDSEQVNLEALGIEFGPEGKFNNEDINSIVGYVNEVKSSDDNFFLKMTLSGAVLLLGSYFIPEIVLNERVNREEYLVFISALITFSFGITWGYANHIRNIKNFRQERAVELRKKLKDLASKDSCEKVINIPLLSYESYKKMFKKSDSVIRITVLSLVAFSGISFLLLAFVGFFKNGTTPASYFFSCGAEQQESYKSVKREGKEFILTKDGETLYYTPKEGEVCSIKIKSN